MWGTDHQAFLSAALGLSLDRYVHIYAYIIICMLVRLPKDGTRSTKSVASAIEFPPPLLSPCLLTKKLRTTDACFSCNTKTSFSTSLRWGFRGMRAFAGSCRISPLQKYHMSRESSSRTVGFRLGQNFCRTSIDMEEKVPQR